MNEIVESALSALVRVLAEEYFELTDDEIVDVIWLASHIDIEVEAVEITPETINTVAGQEGKPDPSPTPDKLDGNSQNQKPNESEAEDKEHLNIEFEVYAASDAYNLSSQSSGSGLSGVSWHAPASESLPGKLDIGRSLRPLKKQVPSNRWFEIDEEATVNQIVETDLWLPIMRPATVRWLDVVLVIDQWPSMSIWHQTISEFKTLLAYMGAFRNIQTYSLKTVTDERNFYVPELHTFTQNSYHLGRRCRLRELIDPLQQRLILILTDCTSPIWLNGEAADLLETWGNQNMVTLINLLPERLWKQTTLSEATHVIVHKAQAGTPNKQLKATRLRGRQRNKKENRVPFPIVTLEPEYLLSWAKFVTARSELNISGICFPKRGEFPVRANVKNQDSLEKEIPLDPDILWARFKRTLTRDAQELAGYLAATPLSFPVMRLVQNVMMPHSRQPHLAEVFRSGLLKRITPADADVHPDRIQYDFVHPQIRKKLLATVQLDDTEIVLEAVSRYIDSHLGSARGFHALIFDREADGDFTVDEHSLPFARIASTVLRHLGGHYNKKANLIDGKIHQKANIRAYEDAQLLSTNTSSRSGASTTDVWLKPGENFIQEWEVKNTGQTTWDDKYKIVPIEPSSTNVSVRALTRVTPGEQVKITLDLPGFTQPGRHSGFWQLQNPQGNLFGPRLPYEVNIDYPLPDLIFDFSNLLIEKTRSFNGDRNELFRSVSDWLDNLMMPRTFVISGDHGSGKTNVSARLVQISEGKATEVFDLKEGFISAFHFCRKDNPDTFSTEKFIRSLSIQLAHRWRNYARLLPTDFYSARSSIEETYRDLLQQPLYRFIGSVSNPICFLIDGLDDIPSPIAEKSIIDLIKIIRNDFPLSLIITSNLYGIVNKELSKIEKATFDLAFTSSAQRSRGRIPGVPKASDRLEITFENFDLEITKTGSTYTILAAYAHGGEVKSTLADLNLVEETDVKALLVSLGTLSGSVDQAGKVGRLMRERLFSPDIWSLFIDAKRDAKNRSDSGLRIRLRIEPPEIGMLPWEYCLDKNDDFLALDRELPIVRYIDSPSIPDDVLAPRPVRVLLASASPSDMTPVDAGREAEHIFNELQPLVESGELIVEHLNSATRESFQSELVHFGPHILHFIGHGEFNLDSGKGALFLEGQDGKASSLSHRQLAVLLHNTEVRVIILNACKFAAFDQSNAFMGLAPALVRADVPAVIAIQFAMPDNTAARFARQLYHYLAIGLPLDRAITEARIHLYTSGDDYIFWATPVLFMRTKDGRIWKRRT